MKKIKTKIAIILTIFLLTIIFQTTKSNAVLESRPDSASLVNKTASEFFALIRKMETQEGPLGLNATITDEGTETSQSNNIDVHMIKNTEYGTVGMLAASIYGANSSTGRRNNTTTGNATGIYQMGTGANGDQYEYVAGILGTSTSSNIKNIKNAPSRYWDNYTTEQVSKPGDGMLEIGWRAGLSWVSSSYPVFYRNYRNGVFDTDRNSGGRNSTTSSRAVVVVGAGV